MEDYKKKLKEARLEAGKLMTEKQIKACNGIIHTASAACAAAGFIPIPVADAIPISAAQVTMIVSLGKTFDIDITESAAKSIISAAAATLIGRTVASSILKLIPGPGWIMSAAIAAGITEAIGWITAVDFSKQYRKEFDLNKAQEAAKSNQSAEQTVDDTEEELFTETVDPGKILNPEKISEQVGEYLFIGRVGWLASSLLALREKPDISSDILINIPCGTELCIYATPDSKWFATEYQGHHGFVVSKLIEKVREY